MKRTRNLSPSLAQHRSTHAQKLRESSEMAEAVAAVPAEVRDAIATAQEAAAALVTVGFQLEVAGWSTVRVGRATLYKAAELVREDIHDTKIVVAHAFAVVPTLNGRDPAATLAASAKLVASVFSEAPVLPGAIAAAMDLAASVSAIAPPVTGTLWDVLVIFKAVSEDHHRARTLFVDCVPYIGIGEDYEAWEEFSYRRRHALTCAVVAEMRLNGAIGDAQHSVRIHRFCQNEAPRRGRRMREAWKLKGILRSAIAAEEEIVHQVIDDAAP
uniref:Uncharacterized protein n=1 Tax=Oryza brachyantha TaxID=4533 RepID=J3LBV9_ORYBR